MKVSVAIFLAVIGIAVCELKAPYLPSGWRPKGPAFELPTEVKIISLATAAEEETTTTISEVEANESLSFKEYGPPRADDILQDITIQALPDVEGISNFRIIETTENLGNNEETGKVETVVTVEKTEEKIENVKETKREKQSNESQTNVVQNVGISSGQETVVEGRTTSQIFEQVETNNLKESSESSFKSIQETLNVLEKEITKVEAREESLIETIRKEQQTEENQAKGKSEETESPAGFLEYGVPHQEYGPPKDEESSNGADDSITIIAGKQLDGDESEKSSEDSTTEAALTETIPVQSETRRRRFSTRIRTLRH